MKLDSKIPSGAIHEKWSNRKFELKLVNPANKRKYKVIVVGSGLAGASAAASLGELGQALSGMLWEDEGKLQDDVLFASMNDEDQQVDPFSPEGQELQLELAEVTVCPALAFGLAQADAVDD